MDTFMSIERATIQWLVQSYERRTLRRAVRQAYTKFARQYPNWVAALFDEHFVMTHLLPILQRAADAGDADAGDKVTALQIAELWVRQVSVLPTLRQKHIARVMPAATHFLCMVADTLAEANVGHHANTFVETAVG